MNPDVSERAFEEAIEPALLQFGPDALDAAATREASAPYSDAPPGG